MGYYSHSRRHGGILAVSTGDNNGVKSERHRYRTYGTDKHRVRKRKKICYADKNKGIYHKLHKGYNVYADIGKGLFKTYMGNGDTRKKHRKRRHTVAGGSNDI